MTVELLNPQDKKRPPGFSQGARVADWVFVSGQLAWDSEGGIVGKGDIKAQAERAFECIDDVLGIVGGGLSDIVKLTAYLVNPVHFQGYWDTRARLFPTMPPADTTVAANSLALPEALIEIEAYAHLGRKNKLLLPPDQGTGISYSQGSMAGNTIWVSGQTSLDREGNLRALGDPSGQLRASLRNVEEVLQTGGASLRDLVKVNYFLTNPTYYDTLFQIREESFKENGPADDVASIRALGLPELLFETEAVAVVPPAKAQFLNPPGVPAPFNYSQVVVADGLVYISGQTPWNKDRELVGKGDFDAQFSQAFSNVETCLRSVGCTFDNVAKITYYITHAARFVSSRDIRSRYFQTHPPAVTAIAVDGIGGFPDLMCEVDAIAELP